MKCLVISILIAIQLIRNIKCVAPTVINRYDDSGCALNAELINEIKSYKNVTKQIMDEVLKSGKEFYAKYTEFIDKFGARVSGTQNLEDAIDYMIALTHADGLSTVTTEPVDVPHWVKGEETASMLEPRQKHIAILGLGSSVPTPENGITAEVIVVKSFDEFEKLEDVKVKGKIVLFNPVYVSYGNTVRYRSQGATRAAEKGAVAALIRSITPFSLYTLHTGAQFYAENVTKIPSASVTVEDADLLERLHNKGHKIVLKIKMNSTIDTKKSRNTLVDLKGNAKPDQYVIVSGHIDSWDVGQGAMDDGGGMFISWYAPVVLHKLGLTPRRTLRAVLWTAEEPGLIGAAGYLEQHKNELDKINFIMESDEGTFKPLGLGVGGSKQARCMIAEVLKLFSPVDRLEAQDAPGSDIVLFVREGVPGAALLNQNDKYFWFHHTDADTMDVQNMDDVINCAAFWCAVSFVIADLPMDIPRK